MKAKRTVIRTGLLSVFCVISYANVDAHEVVPADEPYGDVVGREFSLGIGVGFERFDTSVKITDLASDRNVFIDLEGTLELPEEDTMPLIYGYYRPNKKHGFGFSYFRVKREGNIFAVDENFDDLNVTGTVTFSDDTSFYYLSYNYTAYEDERAFVFASLGLYGLDLHYKLNAQGTITYQDVPITSGQFERGVNIFAPLPLLGIDAWFALTPKWAIGAKVAIVGGTYNNISAFVMSSRIRARYALSDHFAIDFGVNYLDADVTIDSSDRRSDVQYGFSGFAAALNYRF